MTGAGASGVGSLPSKGQQVGGLLLKLAGFGLLITSMVTLLWVTEKGATIYGTTLCSYERKYVSYYHTRAYVNLVSYV